VNTVVQVDEIDNWVDLTTFSPTRHWAIPCRRPPRSNSRPACRLFKNRVEHGLLGRNSLGHWWLRMV